MCAENQKTLKFYTKKGKGKAGLHCDTPGSSLAAVPQAGTAGVDWGIRDLMEGGVGVGGSDLEGLEVLRPGENPRTSRPLQTAAKHSQSGVFKRSE